MKQLLPRVLLAIASSLLTLLLIEGVWRIRTRGYGPTTNPTYVLHDDDLGWRYRPGTTVRHASDDFDVLIEIGSEGYRDSKPTRAKGAETRVLAIGDSLTFGWGVPAGESFCGVLDGREDLEVYNRGVSGYGTDQQLLLLRREIEVLTPDCVLVTFCANDVDEVLRDRSYGKGKPRFLLAGDRLSLTNTPVPFPPWERWSVFCRWASRHIAESRAVPLSVGEVDRGRALVLRLWREMADVAIAHDASVIVVHAGESWLSAPPRVEGLRFVDVAPALEAAGQTGPVTFASDPHWNGHGHRAVAGAIAAALRL